jgi:di/tricarboxylate transporter
MVSTLFIACALRVTGVSDALARWVHRIARGNERTAIAMVMLSAAVFSGFINNVSAVALLMPAVAVLAHEGEIPPSRLFIPLAYAVTTGGMLTLIGTPPNLLASELLRGKGLEPFSFFSFTPYGLVATMGGTLFMLTYGLKVLPIRKTQRRTRRITDLRALYRLHDRLFSVRVPEGAPLEGHSLAELRFGSLIGGVVVTIIRAGRKLLSPKADEKLRERDVLLVRGNPEKFNEVQAMRGLEITASSEPILRRIQQTSEIVRFRIREVHTEARILLLRDVLRASGIIPLFVERNVSDEAWETHPPSWFLDAVVHKGDVILGCIGGRYAEDFPTMDVELEVIERPYGILSKSLYVITVSKGGWSGAPLHRLAHETKLPILARISQSDELEWLDVPTILPGGDMGPTRLTADHILRESERYLVSGTLDEARRRELLSTLLLEAEAGSSELESTDVGIVEIVLAPRSELIGQTLADLHFREKYDSQVLTLWKDGKPHLSLSSGLPLVYGDALLIQGPRKSFPLLAKDPDFLLLSEDDETPKVSVKSVFALLALLMLIALPLITGMPVHEAAFLGACTVVLSGAISMEQAYREIEWRAVFLVALMLPLAKGVEQITAAPGVVTLLQHTAGSVPPVALAALFMVAGSVMGQLVDGSIAVILLGPVAIAIGQNYAAGHHYGLLLAVTLGSSLAFVFPNSCRPNMLITGAGGYRSSDFVRIGVPFTAILGFLLMVMIALREF